MKYLRIQLTEMECQILLKYYKEVFNDSTKARCGNNLAKYIEKSMENLANKKMLEEEEKKKKAILKISREAFKD